MSVSYFFVHNAQSLGVLCGDNYTARIAVNTVAQRRGKGLLRFWVILSLLAKISLKVHSKGVVRPLGILVNKDSRALVEKHNIFVLVKDIQLRGDSCKCTVILFGGIEKLLSYEKLYGVALAKHIFLLCSFAVDLYFFGSYKLIHHRRGQTLDSLRKKLVKSLTRIVFVYRYFSHKIYPLQYITNIIIYFL